MPIKPRAAIETLESRRLLAAAVASSPIPTGLYMYEGDAAHFTVNLVSAAGDARPETINYQLEGTADGDDHDAPTSGTLTVVWDDDPTDPPRPLMGPIQWPDGETTTSSSPSLRLRGAIPTPVLPLRLSSHVFRPDSTRGSRGGHPGPYEFGSPQASFSGNTLPGGGGAGEPGSSSGFGEARLDFNALINGGVEPNETLIFRLLPGNGYTISTNSNGQSQDTATRTIRDNTPTVTVKAVALNGLGQPTGQPSDEVGLVEGGTDGRITFTRSGGDINKKLTVTVTKSGDASSDDLAGYLPDSFSFNAGVTERNFTIGAKDEPEGDEETEHWDGDATTASFRPELLTITIDDNIDYQTPAAEEEVTVRISDNTFSFSGDELKSEQRVIEAANEAWNLTLRDGWEYGFLIYYDYRNSAIVTGQITTSQQPAAIIQPDPLPEAYYVMVGRLHTHPGGTCPSQADKDVANGYGVVGLIKTGSGIVAYGDNEKEVKG